MPGVTSIVAMKVAERVQTALQKIDLSPRGERIAVTASFGVAEMREVGARTPAELVAAADAALYEAKKAGRDRVVVAHPLVCKARLTLMPAAVSAQA